MRTRAEEETMEVEDAIELIRPAVPPAGGVWAELGAGSGTFTRALAELAGPDARIFALDRDPRALQVVRDWARGRAGEGAAVVPVHADVSRLDTVAELVGVELDGALLANSLHFLPDADLVLVRLTRLLRPGGRVVVVEYDGRPPSRWVPHPLPLQRLRSLAARAGLQPPEPVGERPSAYGGTMYCAVAER